MLWHVMINFVRLTTLQLTVLLWMVPPSLNATWWTHLRTMSVTAGLMMEGRTAIVLCLRLSLCLSLWHFLSSHISLAPWHFWSTLFPSKTQWTLWRSTLCTNPHCLQDLIHFGSMEGSLVNWVDWSKPNRHWMTRFYSNDIVPKNAFIVGEIIHFL